MIRNEPFDVIGNVATYLREMYGKRWNVLNHGCHIPNDMRDC